VSFAFCEYAYVTVKGLQFVWIRFEHSIWEKLGDSICVISFSCVAFWHPDDFISGQMQIGLGALAIPIAFAWGRVCLRRCGPAKSWF